MRSTTRRLLSAMILTAAAGFALSQEASAPPPPPAPDAAAPVAELPQLPVVSVPPVPDRSAPAVDPARTIDPSVLAVAPAGAPKTSPANHVAKPAVEATGSFEPVTVESLNPPNAPANTTLAESDVPVPVAVKLAIPETPAESGPRSVVILGEWMLAGILIVALSSGLMLLRRRTQRRTGLIDLKAIELKPAPATRM